MTIGTALPTPSEGFGIIDWKYAILRLINSMNEVRV